jgi:hypothetical protein
MGRVGLVRGRWSVGVLERGRWTVEFVGPLDFRTVGLSHRCGGDDCVFLLFIFGGAGWAWYLFVSLLCLFLFFLIFIEFDEGMKGGHATVYPSSPRGISS